MHIKETIITKTVTTEVPALQITFTIEEAKALRAIGATSCNDRTELLQDSDGANQYKDQYKACSKLLEQIWDAADSFVKEIK